MKQFSISLLMLLFLSSCTKKYNCTCTTLKIECYNCYASNEPQASYHSWKENYIYHSKDKTGALESCNRNHAVDTYTTGNDLTSVQCKIE